MSFTEDNYEKAVIALFEQMGYRHLYGPDIERDYYVPFYEEQLLLSLANLNRGKPQAALQEAVGKLKDIDTGSLAQKNERFMDYLQHGIEVSYFDGREQRNDLVYLIDYAHTERNDFQIVNQWTFVEHSEKRADLVVFVNGLPLVVMELKSPSREETDASEAYRQLRNYMQEIPEPLPARKTATWNGKPGTAIMKVRTLPTMIRSLKASSNGGVCWTSSETLSASRRTRLGQPRYWRPTISILL